LNVDRPKKRIKEPRKPKSGRIETIGREADGGERRAQEEEREGGA